MVYYFLQMKRRIISFEPCGPVGAMIDIEVRGKKRGAQTRLIEEALATHLARKYPKLFDRFTILRAEGVA
jgi:hypothetical protein